MSDKPGVKELISKIETLFLECKDMCNDQKLSDIVEEKHVDIPMCDDFPNLRGLTCEDIYKKIDEIKSMMPAGKKDRALDYIKHIKVYNNEEEYNALKEIGKQMERALGPEMYSDSTVYITTPRGGHEILSKFAYANKITKTQIPSDILMLEELKKYDPLRYQLIKRYLQDQDIIGSDWLESYSDKIKKVVIVDDVLASGEEMNTAIKTVKKKIPDAKIYVVTLCDRGEEHRHSGYKINADKRFTDTPTVGWEDFFKMKTKDNGYVDGIWTTCVFSHACPEGHSDLVSEILYGGRRCPLRRERT